MTGPQFLLFFLILGNLFITQAKPQYDAVNSGNSGVNSPATTTKSTNPIVRVDGDVHAEEAEENGLPGGLNPSGYDSDSKTQNTTSSKSGQKSANAKRKPSSADNSPLTKNVTIIPTKRPQQSAYESDTAPKSAQNPESPKSESFVVGGETTDSSSTTSEIPISETSETPSSETSGTPSSETSTTPSSETSTTPSIETTSEVPETSASPTKSATEAQSSTEQSKEISLSTEQQTESPSTQTTETTNEEKSDDHATQPFSSELYESSTPTNDAQLPTTETNTNISTASGEKLESTETTIRPTTGQNSYESAESGSSSPTPPTATQITNDQEETSTLPPAIEPSSPGTSSDEQAYESTTTSVETSSTESSTQATDTYSPQITDNENQPTSTSQPSIQNTEASGSGSRLGASADFSHSSGYDNDAPPASVLSKPPAENRKPEAQSSPSSTPQQTKRPASKPRAWKISQGNSQPVDGSTGTSDNSYGTKQTAAANENKNIQASGYGENEVKPQTEKPAHVVSAQEAVGYDGIAEMHMAQQRDPIVERAEVTLSQLQKRVDAAPSRRKWQKYEFNCDTETDDRSEALCQEWARGGLCDEHRPTRFLFCRKTCLCVGPPPEDPVAKLKQRRRKRLHNVRL